MISAGATTTATRWMEPGDDIKATLGRLRLSIECKDHASYNFGGWLDQAQSNAEGCAIPVVVAHRKGKAKVEEAYVVLAGGDFVRLLAGAGNGPLCTGPCCGWPS